VVDHEGDVSYSRSDKVSSALRAWMRKAGVKRAVKALRATAASKLGEHGQYKYFAQYFLGHAPRTVADRHYVRPHEAEFAESLMWLRKELLG
jgi:hypothetical protein